MNGLRQVKRLASGGLRDLFAALNPSDTINVFDGAAARRAGAPARRWPSTLELVGGESERPAMPQQPVSGVLTVAPIRFKSATSSVIFITALWWQ
jgi:hypothetical protein